MNLALFLILGVSTHLASCSLLPKVRQAVRSVKFNKLQPVLHIQVTGYQDSSDQHINSPMRRIFSLQTSPISSYEEDQAEEPENNKNGYKLVLLKDLRDILTVVEALLAGGSRLHRKETRTKYFYPILNRYSDNRFYTVADFEKALYKKEPRKSHPIQQKRPRHYSPYFPKKLKKTSPLWSSLKKKLGHHDTIPFSEVTVDSGNNLAHDFFNTRGMMYLGRPNNISEGKITKLLSKVIMYNNLDDSSIILRKPIAEIFDAGELKEISRIIDEFQVKSLARSRPENYSKGYEFSELVA